MWKRQASGLTQTSQSLELSDSWQGSFDKIETPQRWHGHCAKMIVQLETCNVIGALTGKSLILRAKFLLRFHTITGVIGGQEGLV